MEKYIIIKNIPRGYGGEPVWIITKLEPDYFVVSNGKGGCWQCWDYELKLIEP